MSKRNSKSSNVSSAVVVRRTVSPMRTFSSSCSELCNEGSFMSVRRAEAELRWFKRNRENTLVRLFVERQLGVRLLGERRLGERQFGEGLFRRMR